MLSLHDGGLDGSGDSSPEPEGYTAKKFSEFVQNASAGTTILYHLGYLPEDRKPPFVKKNGKPPTPEQERVVELARMAWWAASCKFVDLTQNKLGAFSYAYYASKRKKAGR